VISSRQLFMMLNFHYFDFLEVKSTYNIDTGTCHSFTVIPNCSSFVQI
jgi:hypothetical protein